MIGLGSDKNKLVDIVAARDLGMSLVAHCPARYHNNKAQQYGNKRKEIMFWNEMLLEK